MSSFRVEVGAEVRGGRIGGVISRRLGRADDQCAHVTHISIAVSDSEREVSARGDLGNLSRDASDGAGGIRRRGRHDERNRMLL